MPPWRSLADARRRSPGVVHARMEASVAPWKSRFTSGMIVTCCQALESAMRDFPTLVRRNDSTANSNGG